MLEKIVICKRKRAYHSHSFLKFRIPCEGQLQLGCRKRVGIIKGRWFPPGKLGLFLVYIFILALIMFNLLCYVIIDPKTEISGWVETWHSEPPRCHKIDVQPMLAHTEERHTSARSPSIKIGLPVTWAGNAPLGKPTSPGTLRNSTKPI